MTHKTVQCIYACKWAAAEQCWQVHVKKEHNQNTEKLTDSSCDILSCYYIIVSWSAQTHSKIYLDKWCETLGLHNGK